MTSPPLLVSITTFPEILSWPGMGGGSGGVGADRVSGDSDSRWPPPTSPLLVPCGSRIVDALHVCGLSQFSAYVCKVRGPSNSTTFIGRSMCCHRTLSAGPQHTALRNCGIFQTHACNFWEPFRAAASVGAVCNWSSKTHSREALYCAPLGMGSNGGNRGPRS